MDSGGWIRVRDLLDYDRDREAESSWASYHLGYCCPADFFSRQSGPHRAVFPHYQDLVGQHPYDVWLHAGDLFPHDLRPLSPFCQLGDVTRVLAAAWQAALVGVLASPAAVNQSS